MCVCVSLSLGYVGLTHGALDKGTTVLTLGAHGDICGWVYVCVGMCVCVYVFCVRVDGVGHRRNLPRPHVGAAAGRNAAVEEREAKRRMLLRTRMFFLVCTVLCLCVCVL